MIEIQSADDINLARIIREIPHSVQRLRAFTRGGTIEVTDDPSYVAAVRLTKDGPLFKFSRPVINEEVESITELAFAVYHEMLHIIEGHQNLPGLRHRFQKPDLMGEFVSLDEVADANINDLDPDDRQTFQQIKFACELELKHMEHLLLPQDRYHTLNKRVYGGADDDKTRILYRGTNPEEFDNPIYRLLHRRVFSDGAYSPVEAYRILDREMDEDEQMPAMAVAGGGSENDDNDNDDGEDGPSPEILHHDESGIDEDANAEDIRALAEAIEEGMEEAEEDDESGGDEPEEEDQGEEAEGEAGDPSEPGDDEDASDSSYQPNPGFEVQHEQMKDWAGRVDQPQNPDTRRELQKAGTSSGYLSKVAEDLEDQVGKAFRFSVIPNFQSDHNARIEKKLGLYTPKYRHNNAPNQDKVALYYDISGSQTDFIPACNEIVLHHKRFLKDRTVFLFSTDVKGVRISRFHKLVESGNVQNELSSIGTDFDVVVEHARQNRFSRIAVLTDDASRFSDENRQFLKRGGLEHILAIITQSPERVRGGWGFVGHDFADSAVFIDPVTA